ncbi:MAG: hypothetical protein LBD86_05155 [Spirochaetaceae bacterium]|jgi:hypothetical protein|nr:hypothetical protein [Spirochaetaceae bacterium]
MSDKQDGNSGENEEEKNMSDIAEQQDGDSGGSSAAVEPVKNAPPPPPFIDQFYKAVDDVIGGDNNNQFFCMTLPGMAVVPENYSYDYKNHGPKPAVVMANESKLANKLFDACHMTGADNGRSLPQMYRTALDILTPKLNAKIAEAKTRLRELLMTPYDYDFGDGVVTGHTLQQVFYRLYDAYVDMKEKWVKLQADKQDELREKYHGDNDESNKKYTNEYLLWYETVAETYSEGLNGQRGKILAVFSPNDMKIIEGVLDSGSGAELEEARETLENTRKQDPDGGYIYPVTLYPENWFELLDNSFMGVDLLESPGALADSLVVLTRQRNNLVAQINQITAAVPGDKTVEDAREKLKAAQDGMDTASVGLVKSYGDGAKTVFQAALQLGKDSSVLGRLAGAIKIPEEKTPENLIEDLSKLIGDGMGKQQALVNAGNELADAAMKSSILKAMASLAPLLGPLKARLDSVNDEINGMTNKINIAQAVQGNAGGGQSKDMLTPNKIPKGFTQIIMETAASSLDSATSKSASASQSTCGVNFLFCGYNQNKEESQSAYDSFTQDKNMKIQIGLSLAKVGIGREWFNPGLFLLSRDMCNVTTQKFSPSGPYDGFDGARFKAMNDCLFPCYPTAFVVARDVTVKFSTSSSISDNHARAMESHTSRGGGCLCFSGSGSSSSSSSSSSVHTKSDSNSITIRFADPQILGYYLEATPPDASAFIDDMGKDAMAGYVTIIDFVQKCKEMLEDYNKKYGNNKQ